MTSRILLPLMLLLCLMQAGEAAAVEIAPLTLTAARTRVQSEFDRLDNGIRLAAGRLGKSGLTGAEARAALADLCKGFNWAIDCAAIDDKGVMVTIEPAPYRRFEGISIAQQEQFIRMLQARKPLLSSVFMTVEGVAAIDVEYPITRPNGEFIGAVSLLFKPERLLAATILPVTKGVPMDIWAMETDGQILYDVDSRQIGLNLFTAPLYQPYPSLLALGQQIAREPAGSGVYNFLERTGKKVIAKRTYWQTVSLYETPWRLVGVHPEGEISPVAATPTLQEDTARNLDQFVKNKALPAALAKGNKAAILKLFQQFHSENPKIYSIQWLDARGVTRFGYPAGNSLLDYDFRAGRTAEDQQVVKILGEKKAATLEASIFEGNRGVFVYRPVFKGKRYLGMVYLIMVK